MAAEVPEHETWTGSLIDVLGYEGRLSLELRRKRNTIDGRFTARIGGQHEPIVRDGDVSGKADGERLVLELGRAEDAIRIHFEGHTFALSDSGTGMCGSYEVAARGFTPLGGGVVALSRDRRSPAVQVKASKRARSPR